MTEHGLLDMSEGKCTMQGNAIGEIVETHTDQGAHTSCSRLIGVPGDCVDLLPKTLREQGWGC